jgi:hypothetical protein
MKLRIFVAGMIFIASSTAFSGVHAQQTPSRSDTAARRAMLEQRLRQRTGDAVKRRLQLTDDQMRRLQATNQQFEKQRTALVTRERDVRREMRQQIMAGDSANQNRVAELLEQVMQLERQRLDLVQSEQREVAKFLNPVQRAKLMAFQNELRNRTQQLRNRPMQRPGGQRRAPLRME